MNRNRANVLTFSISSFITAYFNCYFLSRTDQLVAFIGNTLHEIIVKPGKILRLPLMRLLTYIYIIHSRIWRIAICIVCNIHAIYNGEQICKENVEQKGTILGVPQKQFPSMCCMNCLFLFLAF